MSWKRLFGTAASVALVALGVAVAPSAATPHALAATPPDISVSNIQAHLSQLQTIASQHNGNRRAGSGGHTASVAYVKDKLQAAGYQVVEQNCGSCSYPSNNLIADWPGGPDDQVIMFGAHLDSVSAGPGINDNGSGSATILEVALALAQQNPAMTKHVRFAWWTGEEQGLEGSSHYVANLTSAQRSAIEGYYNFDMVASPNGGYFINNINDPVSAPMKAYWDSLNLQPENDEEGIGRSDDYPFSRYGIPTSAYASGADWTKTSAQASKWGGTAGQSYDSCYHRACDTTSNINTTILNHAADGVAYTLWQTSVGSTNPGNDFSVSLSPASGTVQPGSSTSFTVDTATTAGSAQPLSLSASGAPAGVTVSFSPQSIQSGQSATATVTAAANAAAGSYPITVTAEGESAHTATFTLSVGGDNGCAPTQLITNGGFESGSAPWTATSGVLTSAGSGQPAHAGSRLAWLDGYGRTHTDSLAQTVSVPAGCGATLTYYLHVDTSENTTSTQYDTLTLTAGGTTLATYSNLDAASGYQQRTVDLSSFAGQSITLKWTGSEDTYLQTSFTIDDVAVQTG